MSATLDSLRPMSPPATDTGPDDTVAPRGRLALTVGPVLYHWPRTALLQFYAELADSRPTRWCWVKWCVPAGAS